MTKENDGTMSPSLSEVRAQGEAGQTVVPVGTGDVYLYPVEGNHWDGSPHS